MNRFKDLNVWKKSIDLTAEIYKLTSLLPTTERFGLCTQLNRASVSIASNIAEGAGRNSDKDYCRFLSISQGSAFELETQLIICCRLNYFREEDLVSIFRLITDIQNMLFSLHKKRQSYVFLKYNPLTYLALISSTILLHLKNFGHMLQK